MTKVQMKIKRIRNWIQIRVIKSSAMKNFWNWMYSLTLWTDISSTRHSSIDSSREWPEISILIRWERIDLTSSSSSPASSGKTWGQSQKETQEMGGNEANGKNSSASSLKLYQPLLIPCGLWAWDGGLADGLTDGLCLKLRTRCLSITIFVPLPFQPVGLDFNIPLKWRQRNCVAIITEALKSDHVIRQTGKQARDR